jgi:hypothetical protein
MSCGHGNMYWEHIDMCYWHIESLLSCLESLIARVVNPLVYLVGRPLPSPMGSLGFSWRHLQ